MAPLIQTVLSVIAPRLFDVVDEAVTDKDQALKLKAELAALMADRDGEMAKASAKILTAEITGESWLQRNWRPMLMVWFAFLIGAYWFGWTPPNMDAQTIDNLFVLVQIGVGGYVVGRSGEKIAKTVAPVLASRKG